jgi:hypothetical protein
MITDFERCRRTIGRREVTITSWIDERKQLWSASAPAFIHVLAGSEAMAGGAASRAQAIERIVRALNDRLVVNS